MSILNYLRKRGLAMFMALIMCLSLVQVTVFAEDGTEETQTPDESQAVAVTGITLDPTTLNLTAGDTAALTAAVVPDDATDQTIAWSSDNESVATVADGLVTAVATGTATITAKAGEFEAACQCLVETVTDVQSESDETSLPEMQKSIMLMENSGEEKYQIQYGDPCPVTTPNETGPDCTVNIGETVKLTDYADWSGASYFLCWVSTSGVLTATLDNQGYVSVTGNTAGTATIVRCATWNKGQWNASKKFTVTVKDPSSTMITFDLNGGTGDTPAPTNYANGPVTLPSQIYIREGYQFQGWCDKPNAQMIPTGGEAPIIYPAGSTFSPKPGSGDITLYAAWAQTEGTTPTDHNKVAVTIRRDGKIPDDPRALGSAPYDYIVDQYSIGNILDYINVAATTFGVDAVKQNLKPAFDNFVNELIQGNSEWSGKGIAASDIVWYVIKLEQNGGWTGWHFDGVIREKDPPDTPKVFLLYSANCPRTEYTGAVPDSTQHPQNSDATVSGPGNMARSGYTFTGWNTKPDGTGTSYSGGSTIHLGTIDVWLYAQWQKDGEPPVTPDPTIDNIGITKTASKDTVKVGENVVYTITVTNSGEKAVTVTVTDTLPDGLTFVSAGNSGSNNNGTVSWNTVNVPAKADGKDGKAELTVTATVTKTGEIKNTATVTLGDNSKKDDETVTGTAPALTIMKEVDKTSAKPGEELTYRITVTNTGAAEAEGVVITDKLDSTNLTFVSYQVRTNTAVTTAPTDGKYTIGNLAVGASATLTIKATVKDGVAAGTEIKNTAKVGGTNIPEVPSKEVETTVIDDTPAATGQYTVTHMYYTNGSFDASVPGGTFTGTVGTTISASSVAEQRVYNGNTYGAPTHNPDNITIAAGETRNITLSYYRTTTPPSVIPDPYIPPYTPPTTITPTPMPATPTPTPGGTTITDEETPLGGSVGLNDTDHFAYIIGYEDDTVRPLNNISRAEVATIFFRLMTDEYRAANWSTTNDFTDVNAGNWYNNAISTCANAGKLMGRGDGTRFAPDASITRAEFAVIAARFLDESYVDDGTGDFADTAGHWAAKEIRLAAKAGWVTGSGNKFRPDDFITRAEVMTIVNRMLDRTPDEDHMLPTMKTWTDNPKGEWYYEAVQEATNEHDYERDELNVETWTELLTVRDWKALETEWANNGGASAPKADDAAVDQRRMPDGI